ncbi:MAG: NAD(+)/NADH kinase [Clostridia bacterium]|nr:NAD(+)/NADH kinase [Clostridia bacterium]
MKIAIIPYAGKAEAVFYARNVIKHLRDHDCSFAIPSAFSNSIKCDSGEYFDSEFDAVKNADLAVSIGGDGTIIHTAKDAAVLGKPVLGVNCGRVGFVAGLEPGELSMLSRLFTGEYTVDERMLLEVDIKKKGICSRSYALNDVTVTNGAISRMIDLDVYLNGEPINSYRADGVIVATPTGSTAYSLSAGGPVIEPHMKCMLMTPICPHSLFSRSVLFSDDSEVMICKGSASRTDPYVTVDGRNSEKIVGGDSVTMRRAPCAAKFIKLNNKNFYRILNEKLNERMC